MNSAIDKGKSLFEKTIEFLKSDISNLRTGRVAPSLVEKVKVMAYGVSSELLQLAAISTPEPQTIVIKPWDRNILKDIERAISTADLNINPIVDGDIIRLNFPSLTEESRKELVKILHKKLEDSRVSVRQQREKIKDEIVALEKAKQISEDEKFQALKDLDNIVHEYNDKIKLIGDQKEQEIMKI
ncbi:MAG: ribosome recycling factor [Parcubacteria group bacterium]|nr:MAG: ribosome recycling factor [Parcubacteria group bacterium]